MNDGKFSFNVDLRNTINNQTYDKAFNYMMQELTSVNIKSDVINVLFVTIQSKIIIISVDIQVMDHKWCVSIELRMRMHAGGC